MPPALNSVSVVIVNYNAGLFLIDCVQSALQQATQVIVVDNASSDTSLKDLKARFPYEPRLLLHCSERNIGFAAGCNLGLTLGTEPSILFLNPDCVLTPGSLSHMLQVLETHPTAGMVGGFLMNPEGTEQSGGRRGMLTPWRAFVKGFGLTRFATRWPRLFFDFHLEKQPVPEGPIPVEAISGALMLVRRKALQEVGTWDEGYFLHCEDSDWCMRFRQKGWEILFVPNAVVIHQKGVCSRSRPLFVEWHKHKGMVRFYRKFFEAQYGSALLWLIVLGVWLRFIMVAVFYTWQKWQSLFSKYQKYIVTLLAKDKQ